MPLLDRLDHGGNIGRVVLQVAVERGDQPAGCRVDAGLHGGGLSEVLLQFDDLQLKIGSTERLACIGERAVRAAVIDQDQFPRGRKIRHRITDARDERLNAVLFIEDRDDDG
ncbi:hypothetical protein D3C87_1835400 [compost metagenome]